MSCKALVPSFLQKTYDMIDKCDPNTASWTSDGDMFQIRNRQEFETKILPRYFGNQKFSSFTRQLNLYGFQKMQSAPNKNAAFDAEIAKYPTFYHSHFQRGKMELLINIHKQTMKKQPKNGSSSCRESSLTKEEPSNDNGAHASGSSVERQRQIDTLKKRVQSLEEVVQSLQSMVLGHQNYTQIHLPASHHSLMKQETRSQDYHQPGRMKSYDDNNTSTLRYDQSHLSERQRIQDHHDLKRNASKKRVHSDDHFSHYVNGHSERRLTISSPKQSIPSLLSNDDASFYNFEPLSFTEEEKEPSPKRRKSFSGSVLNKATFDIFELQSNSSETVDRSKPTLPPHPKSKSHLPNDIQYLQIPVDAGGSTDRQESLNSFSSFTLSVSLFETTSFPSIDSSILARESSFSTRIDLDSLPSCTVFNE